MLRADLYRYSDSSDPTADGNLTLIPGVGASAIGDAESGSVIVGVSDDGSRVYYHKENNEIFVWHDGVTRLVIGEVNASETSEQRLGLGAWGPGHGRITRDGEFLAFLTEGIQGAGSPMGHVTRDHRELYLYSFADDVIQCVSCPAEPATADVTVTPGSTEAAAQAHIPGIRPRFLSDDGDVFFSTAERLEADDTNGVPDVYRYDPATGDTRLLSSGRESGGATFAEAAPDGDDVFIVTRQRLVKSDTDQLVDLYDVRVEGGFEEPDLPVTGPCQGDACQGAAAPAPGIAPSVSTASSKGNLKPRRCRAGRRTKSRPPARRCARKAGKKKAGTKRAGKRRAGNDRRAGR